MNTAKQTATRRYVGVYALIRNGLLGSHELMWARLHPNFGFRDCRILGRDNRCRRIAASEDFAAAANRIKLRRRPDRTHRKVIGKTKGNRQ